MDLMYDDAVIYLVEIEGSGGHKGRMGVFLERRTAEAWIRSLGDQGVPNKITQTHLQDTRQNHNMAVTPPDLSGELPERPLPPPSFDRPLSPPRHSIALA